MSVHHDSSREPETCRACTPHKGPARTIWKSREIALMMISAMMLAMGLILEFVLLMHQPALFLFLITSTLMGYKIVKEGIERLFKGYISIDLLVTIAAIGAFLIGHGEEGAAVLFLFYLAEFLEDFATERAKESIRLLMELALEVATVKRDGSRIIVLVEKVNVGDVIIVKPGEKIPLDGVVLKGSSTVNQAPITGESVPVFKTVGDEVYAGTLNNEGFLEVKVTKRSSETMLAKIVKLVAEAQVRKSRTEKFIDRFSRYYTPAVILMAILTAIIPTLWLGLPSSTWLYRALVLLVVSCPCALAISTPVAMVSGITSAARKGVLVKGGAYVEEVGKIRAFAFDKTGTLTKGELEVVRVIPFKSTPKKLLTVAASLESLSEHPIARAIEKYALEKGIKPQPVEDFRAIPGKGVRGNINGKMYYVGGIRLFKELGASGLDELDPFEDEGYTIVLVGDDENVLGALELMDKVRKDAFTVIKWLKEHGIKTIMVTGDNRYIANTIAKRLGIDEFYAELLPHEKVSIIEKLVKAYGHVAMVGDGVNDAPALARASVGIAMGVMGSDVALETADIALMEDDLSKIPYLIKLSRKTLEIVKENVVASILIKGVIAVLAFLGMATLWIAVAIGDMGLSLAVILNALRIPRLKLK
ncbi:MAG: cadmium-translocating P-type ATPase [Thermoprotei archaeon]|nr:cadmium-translocating P-type ATPase [Thermoprotei archaeon]